MKYILTISKATIETRPDEQLEVTPGTTTTGGGWWAPFLDSVTACKEAWLKWAAEQRATMSVMKWSETTTEEDGQFCLRFRKLRYDGSNEVVIFHPHIIKVG